MPPISLSDAFTRSDRMVGRRVADEYILVPIVGHGAELDGIYNLSRVAAFIWELLDGTRSGDAVVSAVVDRFDVDRATAEADYGDLLAKLVSIRAVHLQGR
jgi:coenzyme PQQ synthesis protein D (PqqD)